MHLPHYILLLLGDYNNWKNYQFAKKYPFSFLCFLSWCIILYLKATDTATWETLVVYYPAKLQCIRHNRFSFKPWKHSFSKLKSIVSVWQNEGGYQQKADFGFEKSIVPKLSKNWMIRKYFFI